MSSKTVSIELETGNLLWLKGRALAAKHPSMSDLVNDLVSKARSAGRDEGAPAPSVKGTIEICEDDPDLQGADAEVRALFLESVDRFPPE